MSLSEWLQEFECLFSLPETLFQLDLVFVDKIIVGSYHGFLRIYQPHSTSTESGEFSGFSPGDVICEMHLQLPVLQIDAGKFVSYVY